MKRNTNSPKSSQVNQFKNKSLNRLNKEIGEYSKSGK